MQKILGYFAINQLISGVVTMGITFKTDIHILIQQSSSVEILQQLLQLRLLIGCIIQTPAIKNFWTTLKQYTQVEDIRINFGLM